MGDSFITHTKGRILGNRRRQQYRPRTNHRALWIDVSYKCMYGHVFPPIVQPGARRLKLLDPRVVERYINSLASLPIVLCAQLVFFVMTFCRQESVIHLHCLLTCAFPVGTPSNAHTLIIITLPSKNLRDHGVADGTSSWRAPQGLW
jgi:hypothetical protein